MFRINFTDQKCIIHNEGNNEEIVKKDNQETESNVEEDGNIYNFKCPHCQLYIQVQKDQINCTIFRHGYFYIKNGNDIILTEQINPHTNKEDCDRLVKENRIVGCGKPFQMIRNESGKYSVKICGYI